MGQPAGPTGRTACCLIPRWALRECRMRMQDRLFQSEEFGTSAQPTATIIFVCPYGTPIQKVRFAIRRLLRAGYHVVAYQTTAAVFTEADPMILPELISQVRDDIRSR